jgi:nicotinamide riboside kinase
MHVLYCQTKIRVFNRNEKNNSMQADIFKIVLTGPESTGKTSLAVKLAGILETAWVPEFARPYVAFLGRPYLQEDLVRMAAGQRHWEAWYALKPAKFLVCDTDWTVFQVWNDFRYDAHFFFRQNDEKVHYLLCAPDFPWEPDPLRESPNDRDLLFSRYERLLTEQGLPYTILTGSLENRLKISLEIIRQLC